MIVKPDKPPEQSVSLPPFNLYSNREYGVSLSYSADAESAQITSEDQKNKIFLRIQHKTSPEYLITARAETGLRLPSQLSRVDVLDLVVNGASASLPSRYSDMTLLSSRAISIGETKAHSILFTYTGPGGELVKQSIILAALDADRAVYISMQSRESDFEKLQESVFTPLQESIKIKSTP